MGRRHEARRRQQQLPLLAQFVDFALRPGVGAQGLDSGRHRGAGEDGSRGAGEGRRVGQAPAAGRYGRRPCGHGAVISAGSRRALRLFAPTVRANDSGERGWISDR